MWALLFILMFQDGLTQPDYRFETVPGVSMSVITAMHQDRAGLLWFGTLEGLDRYDGHRFTHYRHIPGSPDSLADTLVHAVGDDLAGNLWIGTNVGLNRLQPGAIGFDFIELPNRDGPALQVLGTDDGSVWVATPQALYRRTPQSQAFEQVFDLEPVAESVFFLPMLVSGNFFWLGTPRGLWRFDLDGSNPQRIALNASSSETQPARVRDLAADGTGQLWIASDLGLFKHLPTDLSASQPTLVGGDIHSVLIGPEDSVWLGVKGTGLVVHDPSSGAFHTYEREPGKPNCFQAESVDIMMADRTGVIWLGSSGFGLTRCNPAVTAFQSFPHLAGAKAGPAGSLTLGFHQDDRGQLFVATSRGLNAFDPQTREFEPVALPDPISSTSYTRNIAGDHRGGLWLNLLGQGLLNLNQQQGSRFYGPDQQTEPFFPSRNIGPLLSESADQLWVGTADYGLLLLNPVSQILQSSSSNSQLCTFSDKKVTALLRDQQQRLWVGTAENGVIVMDATGQDIQVFKNQPQNAQSLPGNYVLDLAEDGAGRIWVGMVSAGVSCIDADLGQIRTYNAAHGLANETIYSIISDPQGFIWLGTTRGISRFDLASESFVNFYQADGLAASEFNSAAVMFDRAGWLYFGGIGGMTRFRPNQVQPYAAPDLLIPHYRIAHGKLRAIDPQTMPIFEPDQQIISFGFTATDFHNPERNRYAYRLDTLGKDWVSLGEGNEVTFTQLPPGTHRLEMMGAGGNGIWQREPVSLEFKVLPYWWQHPLADLLWISAVLLVFVAVWYWRERKHAFRLAVEKAELKAIQAQINPHFLFNTLNSIAELIPQRPDDAEDVVLQLSDYFRDTLTISQNMEIRLDQEIQIIRDYLTLEKVRFGDRLFFSLHIDPELEQIIIPGLIIQPLVENTMKYALPKLMKPGKIAIDVYRKEGTVVIECRDNGPGFPENWRSRGFGLESIEYRLAHFFGEQAKMQVRNQQGAVVQLQIPLKYCRQ